MEGEAGLGEVDLEEVEVGTDPLVECAKGVGVTMGAEAPTIGGATRVGA